MRQANRAASCRSIPTSPIAASSNRVLPRPAAREHRHAGRRHRARSQQHPFPDHARHGHVARSPERRRQPRNPRDDSNKRATRRRMVSQVLTFARGQEGKRTEIRPVDLITDVVRIVRDTCPRTSRSSPSSTPSCRRLRRSDAVPPGVAESLRQCQGRDAQCGTLKLSADSSAPRRPLETPRQAAAPTSWPSMSRIPATVFPRTSLQDFDPFFHYQGGRQGHRSRPVNLPDHRSQPRRHITLESEPERGTRFDVYCYRAETLRGPPRRSVRRSREVKVRSF